MCCKMNNYFQIKYISKLSAVNPNMCSRHETDKVEGLANMSVGETCVFRLALADGWLKRENV